MVKRSKFEERLFALELPFYREKKTRAEELREFISETADERGLSDQRGNLKEFGITFDRTKNVSFDYWLFDEILVQIAHGVGGLGIRKPMHQMRTLGYRKNAAHLLGNIRYYSGHYNGLKFQRLLVFRLDDAKGYKTIRATYRP